MWKITEKKQGVMEESSDYLCTFCLD